MPNMQTNTSQCRGFWLLTRTTPPKAGPKWHTYVGGDFHVHVPMHMKIWTDLVACCSDGTEALMSL